MIYLLRSYGKNRTLLKIGYAKDLDIRLRQYKTCNPDIELLESREGDLVFEQELHMYFHLLGYGEAMDEWYKDCSEVINSFLNLTQNEVEDKVWKERDKFYTPSYFNLFKLRKDAEDDTPQMKVYKKLYDPDTETSKCEFDLLYDKYMDNLRVQSINLSTLSPEAANFFKSFNSLTNFIDKMKLFCTTQFSSPENEQHAISQLPTEYKNYIIQLGKDKVFALGCQKSKLDAELNKSMLQDISNEIYNTFPIGARLSKIEIKETLKKLYSSCNYNSTAKASDLGNYFNLQRCVITDRISGKKLEGFEIISRK